MTKLYERTANLLRVLDEVDQAIDLDEDLEVRFDNAMGEFEDKVRAAGAALLHAQRDLADQAEWKALVETRHKRAKARVSRLATYIGNQIHRSTLSGVEAVHNGIPITWGCKTTTRVHVGAECDPRAIPAHLTRKIPAVIEVDKVAARAWLEVDGNELAGLEVREHYTAKVS